MSWNYRIVKKDNLFHITEVYYDSNGNIEAWVDPGDMNVLSGWEDLADLEGTAKYALEAFQRPVLEWKPEGHPDGHLEEVRK